MSSIFNESLSEAESIIVKPDHKLTPQERKHRDHQITTTASQIACEIVRARLVLGLSPLPRKSRRQG